MRALRLYVQFLLLCSAAWAGPFDFYGSAAAPEPLPDLAKWKEVGLENHSGATEFKVFRWDYLKDAPANAAGTVDDDLQTIKLFAAPGEYEPVSFCIYAGDRDFSKLILSGSELKGTSGVIPAKCLDLRVIRRVAVREKEPNTYRMLPVCLERHEAETLSRGRTAWVWVDVAVPAGARPGRYYGKIRITEGTQILKEIDVLVRVVDISLMHSERAYGYFIDGRPFTCDRAAITLPEKNLLKALLAHKAFGMNGETMYEVYPVLSIKSGRLEVEFSELIRVMDLVRQAGLTGPIVLDTRMASWQAEDLGRKLDQFKAQNKPMPAELKAGLREPKEWDKDYQFSATGDGLFKQVIEKFLAEGKRRRWPQLMFVPEEELTHGGNKYYGFVHYMKVLHDVPGAQAQVKVKVVLVDNSPFEGVDLGNKFVPWVDVRAYNFANDTIVSDAKKDGGIFWLYNYGLNRESFGLATWRLGAGGNFQWADQWPWDHPYRHLQNVRNCWIVFYPAPDGVLPSPAAIRIREGIDDMRYIETLEAAVGGARKAGKYPDRITEAKKLLKDLRAGIPDERYAFNKYVDESTERKMLVIRWNLARMILLLSGKETK